jgi:O-antigen/teichoic acid export membrane protein
MFGSLHRQDHQETVRLYRKGLKTILLILSPLLLVLGVSAHWILLHWLGPAFALQGTGVMRVLCIGVLINGLAFIPFGFIQGIGRPDLTAKFHMMEIPLYLLCLWMLGTRMGILGVAWAWAIRVTLDFMLLIITAQQIQKNKSHIMVVEHG